MSPQATLDLITQMTEDLQDAYELQAELVLAEMEASRALVGDFKEYRCESWPFCPSGGYYSETRPSGWNLFWHTIRTSDHERQGEAMEALAEAESGYDTTCTAQTSRKDKLVSIPTDVGGFLLDWFSIDASFEGVYYPANTNEIPSNGEPWVSGNAAGYDASIGSQRTAAETTRGVAGGLVSNTTTYLGNVTDSIANLTNLAQQQEQLYLDAIKFAIMEPTIGSFIGAVEDFAQLVMDQRQLFYDRVQEQGRQLSAAISSVVQVGLLENDLTGIGPGGTWPSPRNVSRDLDQPGCTGNDEVRANAEWFQSQVAYWDDLATQMSTLHSTASGASRLPVIMIDMPHFSAAESSSLNGLADSITTAIDGGRAAAESMRDSLRQTARNYLDNEASSTSQADSLFNEYFG
ncbi:hypothetical protein H5392_02405 [Tessaracoccus sp. MC1865]|uniref:hypothetical protein n=1 Tax=Tessaracoccus sp. MC1865 TaxID=2760310 RepID=UPI0015FF8570|nr:hypothetical protein [Tessaracoccus sp. MC1865]MBB1482712.1 hypothetical protein [Tessaracoccus sp. MC1865]QTO37839.1 hypothetical protein J7D54_01685 [Tessaracoccus sp. MC1865]